MTKAHVGRAVVLLVVMLVGACASSGRATPAVGPGGEAPAAPKDEFGRIKERAIEVCGPGGQRAYLARLRCEDGTPPAFERSGSYGSRTSAPPREADGGSDDLCDTFGPVQPGCADMHIVDGYEVRCGSGDPTLLFLDMYHCEAPAQERAPAGFTFVPSTKP